MATPTLSTTNKERYGWIAPNGDYYPCDFYGHSGLAMRLVDAGLCPRGAYGSEHGLETAGWIHLSSSAAFHARTPTKHATDTLFDVCMANGCMGIYELFKDAWNLN